jgi:hypothetical protein
MLARPIGRAAFDKPAHDEQDDSKNGKCEKHGYARYSRRKRAPTMCAMLNR